MPITFSQIKTSSVANISGVDPRGTQFRNIVNAATERLMRRGDWVGMVLPIFVCVTRGCVVWPRYVGEIRRVNICKHAFMPTRNLWWDFLPFDNHYNWGSYGWANWMGSAAHMDMRAKVPVFQDIEGDGRTLRAYPATPLDNNKFITIHGTDTNGQPLMTKGAGGWSMGIKLQLATPFVDSGVQVRKIDSVIKDATQGPVSLFAWNASASVLEPVAYYEPSETNPNYVKTSINAPGCGGCSINADGSAATFGVVALIKLAFVPVMVDDDLALVDNMEALKNMVLAIRSEEAVDFENAAQYEARAIRALNLELANRDEPAQIPVSFGALGRRGRGLGLQRTF